MNDILNRYENCRWIVALIAKQTCPHYVDYINDWLPQFWLAFLEYVAQYHSGQFLDIRWDCVVNRAMNRLYCVITDSPITSLLE